MCADASPHTSTAHTIRLLAAVMVATLCVSFSPANVRGQPTGESPSNTPASGQTEASGFSKVPHEFSVAGERFLLRTGPSGTGDAATDQRPTLSVRHAPTDAEVARLTLPEWFGDSPLSVGTQAGSISNNRVGISLTLAPGATTPSTRRYRFVFDVPTSDSTAWRRVGATEVSRLENSTVLALEEISATDATEPDFQIIRINRRMREMFCGMAKHPERMRDVWVPSDGKFQPDGRSSLTDGVERLDAKVPETALAGPFSGGVYQWFWTGRLSGELQRERLRPTQLGDRRPGTVWRGSPFVTGESTAEGAHYVSARITEAAPVTSIRIVPGDADAPETYRQSQPPDAILLAFSGGQMFVADLPTPSFETLSDRGGLVVDLPEPLRTHCLTVVPLAKASRPEIAISEITPVLTIDGTSESDTARRIIDSILASDEPGQRRNLIDIGVNLEESFARSVEESLDTLIPARDDDSPDTEKLANIVEVLGRLPAKRAIPPLITLFRETSDKPAHHPLRQAVRRSLADHGSRSADALFELLRDDALDAEARLATMRLLSRVGARRHRLALIDSLGKGPWAVRDERNRAISAAGSAALEPTLSVARNWPSVSAGRDALRVASRIGRRPGVEPPMANDKPSVIASKLSEDQSRRTLLLACRAAAVIETENIVKHARALSDHPDPLVRRAAIKALTHYDSDAAREVIVAGLDDRSPDVRIAAVNALADRQDSSTAAKTLIGYVGEESWSAGRSQAIEVLAGIKSKRTDAFFAQLLRPSGEQGANRDNIEVRESAMSALLRADRTIDSSIIIEMITAERGSSESLRLRAVDMLGLENSERGLQVLLDLARDPSAVVQDSAVGTDNGKTLHRRLRQHALLALGRRRSPEARELLESMAFEPTNNLSRVTRRHAIRALGFYDDTSLVPRLQTLLERVDPPLQAVIRQTISMIENRRTLQKLQERIREIETQSKDL